MLLTELIAFCYASHMASERRQQRTPFSIRPYAPGYWSIVSAGGAAIAVVSGDESMAGFIMRACNRYDALLAIYDLCRGRHDNLTQPHTSPHDRAFDALAKQFDADISKHGR